MSKGRKGKTTLIVRVRAWNKENILPQRLDFVMNLIQKNTTIKFFDIQPERKLGYYLGYLFSFLFSYPKMFFTSCDSVLLENPYLVIFSPIFKLKRKKILAEYVDYYPANLRRLKNERFFRYQVAKIICRIFYHFVDIITTESITGKRTLMRWGVPERKIEILPVGINTSKMVYSDQKRKELRKKLQIEENTVVIGYLGKMVKFYSLDNIFKAVYELDTKNQNIKLIFVGDGPERTSLERLASNLGISTIFTGNVPHNEVYAYYSLMDIFVFPLDSLAIKIGEILSINGPILIVPRGMAEDWIRDGYNGIVSSSTNALDLRKAISRVLEISQMEITKIKENQRSFAVDNLDRKIIAKKYLKLM